MNLNDIPTGQPLTVGQFRAALDAGADLPPAPWMQADEPCLTFTPDTPRAPGLCALCGDAERWHRAANAEVLREAIAHEVELHADGQVSALSLALHLVTHPEAPVSTNADYPNWTPGGDR